MADQADNAKKELSPDEALWAAVSHRFEDATRAAINRGANVNAVDEKGYSVLMHLVRERHWESATVLIKAGADVRWVAPDGESAYTIFKGPEEKPEDIKYFLDLRGGAQVMGELLAAIKEKNADEVQCILESGKIIDINLPAQADGYTAVEKCISEDVPVCLDLVLQAGASPNCVRGKSPLVSAIKQWNASPVLVRILLEAGADPDAADKENARPLLKAAAKGQESIVTLLLEHGANVNINIGNGDTAVHEAAEKGHPEIIRILAAHGADLACFNRNGQPPLEAAILNRHREAFDALIEAGADPLQYGKNGITLVMDAAWSGEAGVIPLLVKRGVVMNAQKEDDGFTALMWAAFGGKGESVRQLLDLGANYDLKNNNGKTALDLAREKGHVHVERLITEKIAEDVAAGRRFPDPVRKPFRIVLGMKNA
ncbi:MAG: ankyrin repeat domain-containing protein [Alphaproteobacteria bacterium]